MLAGRFAVELPRILAEDIEEVRAKVNGETMDATEALRVALRNRNPLCESAVFDPEIADLVQGARDSLWQHNQ